MQKYKNKLFLILVVLLSFFTVVPLFRSGFFPIHDNTQVARVFEIHQSLNDGMFPVRWVSDLGYGYGYPIFSFYAPLAYYIGAFFMSLGLSALIATKIMIGLGLILAGISMYVLAKEFWGAKGGLIAGILYAIAPYHGTNVYVRGAIAEMWAYAFIPLAFYGIWQFSKTYRWTGFFLGAIGVAGIVLSHNLSAMMILPLLLILVALLLFSKRHDGKKVFLVLLIPLCGLLLSASYWLPATVEMGYTNVGSQIGGGSDYRDHFVCLSQLWSSPVGFGGSIPGCIDGISLQLGKVHILLLLASLIGSFTIWREKKFFIPLVVAQTLALLGIFFMTSASKLLWDSVSFMKYFQFPWRFTTLFLLGSSFAAGAFFQDHSTFFKKSKIISSLAVIFVGIAVLSLYQKFFVPQSFVSDANIQSERSYIRAITSRISDEYLPKGFDKPKKNSFVDTSFPQIKGTKIVVLEDKTQFKRVKISNDQEKLYVTNITYFPAWQVSIDSKRVAVSMIKGKLAFFAPKGGSVAQIQFGKTSVERLADNLSLGGVFLLTLGIISFRHKDKNEK